MKRRLLLASLVVVAGVFVSCSEHEELPLAPTMETGEPGMEGDELQRGLGGPGYLFAPYEDPEVGLFTRLQKIDLRTGEGLDIGDMGIPFEPTPAIVASAAFGVDGTLYTIANYIFVSQAQLATIDTETAELTLIGEVVPFNMIAMEVDRCGNIFATGFGASLPDGTPILFGDEQLYSIDRTTGAATPIGDTGIERIMDIAFSRDGTLYATTGNKLYTIDTETGASTFITNITGVPDDNEVMGISFDKFNRLNGTAMIGFAEQSDISPSLRIDPTTGVATVVGSTGNFYTHGGDIPPTRVNICHLDLFGEGYRSINISLRALDYHLNHGDALPGTNGLDCNCDPE